MLDGLPGEARPYVSWREQQTILGAMLHSAKRIAMQYSPMNAIPYLSRVDAGTIDFVRSLNVEVVTSADLVQRFEAVWDEMQLASHRVAAEGLRAIVDEAFALCRELACRAPWPDRIWAATIYSLADGGAGPGDLKSADRCRQCA